MLKTQLFFRELLQYGASRPWPELLEEFTGSPKTDASALLEYFLPLEEWLDEQIETLNIPTGWTSSFGKTYEF